MIWIPATTSEEWMKISGGQDYFYAGTSDEDDSLQMIDVDWFS